ncbi:MAG TPA: 5-(carboxyamino)imidazole ribonucleotide synthase, partial [Actinomycetes bacterium]|nr:5-(carboxyamino)imidazole ribonucleotide synthase [Actinomycetes bacterium]
MMQPAAIELGIHLRLLASTTTDSAAQVIPDVVVGDHGDLADLEKFAGGCDVITFDHEHVPNGHLRALVERGFTVHPGPDALLHTQDKGVMRER